MTTSKPIFRTAEVVSFKALEPEGQKADPLKGEYEAIVSVIGNVDRYGEKVLPNAFDETIASWKASGDPLPSIWSHQWDNPLAHLGVVTEVEELKAGDERLPEQIRDLGGLYVKSTVDADLGGGHVNTFALAVLKGMRQRTIKEFSFAYRVEDETKEDDGSRGLKKLTLIEVGPALKGVNPETQLMGTKAYATLSGTVEERQDSVREAVRSWGKTKHGDRSWAYVDGTYDDSVVFTVEVETPEKVETLHYQAPYSTDGDTVTLGEPTEVDLTVTLVPTEKADAFVRTTVAMKAGRVLSKSNEGKLAQAQGLLDEVLSSVQQESTEEPPKAEVKAEDEGSTAADESKADGLTPSKALLNLELDLIEV